MDKHKTLSQENSKHCLKKYWSSSSRPTQNVHPGAHRIPDASLRLIRLYLSAATNQIRNPQHPLCGFRVKMCVRRQGFYALVLLNVTNIPCHCCRTDWPVQHVTVTVVPRSVSNHCVQTVETVSSSSHWHGAEVLLTITSLEYEIAVEPLKPLDRAVTAIFACTGTHFQRNAYPCLCAKAIPLIFIVWWKHWKLVDLLFNSDVNMCWIIQLKLCFVQFSLSSCLTTNWQCFKQNSKFVYNTYTVYGMVDSIPTSSAHRNQESPCDVIRHGLVHCTLLTVPIKVSSHGVPSITYLK